MDDWHQVSDCLDGKLLGALKIEGRSASVGTGKADAAQLIDLPQAGGPAEPEKTASAEAPAQFAGGRSYPLKLVVIEGGRAADSAPVVRGHRPHAAHLRLVTIAGVRVHSSPPKLKLACIPSALR